MRMASLRAWTGLLAFVSGLVRFAAPAAAQEAVLPGQVVDENGEPVASLEVFLHRVTGAGGTIIASDTTDANGAFALRAESDSAEAIYFVAARYREQLYIGAMIRPPLAEEEYVLRVGVNPVGAGAAETTPAAAVDDTNDAAILAIMGALLLVGAVAVLRAVRPSQQRRLLLRLAQLEEAGAAAGHMSPRDEVERSRILARLRFGRTT